MHAKVTYISSKLLYKTDRDEEEAYTRAEEYLALTVSAKVETFMEVGSVMETLAVSFPVPITIAAMNVRIMAVALRMCMVSSIFELEDDLELYPWLAALCVPSKPVVLVVVVVVLLYPLKPGLNCCSM